MKPLKELFTRTSAWFTAISLATLIFGLLFLPEKDHVTALSFLLLFPFSICAAGAGLIWKNKKIPTVWRFLLHYVILLAALILFILLPAEATFSAPTWILLLLLFTILWWISRGLVHILKTKLSGEK